MDERIEQVYRAALAGLLHDVGKFAQRANWRKGEHSQVGGDFVAHYVPQQWRQYCYPVMAHHDRPLPDYGTKLIALADRFSAGERESRADQQPKQLLSIFCRLETESPDPSVGYERAPQAMYWPLKALSLKEDVLFPAELQRAQDVQESYAQLWAAFEEQVQVLRDVHEHKGNLPVYLESLMLLMQRYTWCVPSAYYRSVPDVSLYDHSRTTAALAACLQGTPEATLDTLLGNLHQEKPVALLVGADISGVQDFIYTITARGATIALRGRSFYLQLLAEAVARYILRELGLPMTNLIYQGGGGFYFLARLEDKAQLEEVQQKISSILLDHHQGDLYLALAWETLKAADFFDGHISDKWQALALGQRDAKQQRFVELPSDQLQELFDPQGHGGNEEQQCQVCGREHSNIEPETTSTGEKVRKCLQCHAYEALGKDLRQAQYLWLETPAAPPAVRVDKLGSWEDVLAAFGMRGGVIKDLRSLPENDDGSRVILTLRDLELPFGQRTAAGRRFLVNVTPTITQEEIDKLKDTCDDLPVAESVKPFSAMAEQAIGIKRLGALRMDVDSLGKLFSDGFILHSADGTAERVATLSRMATLSFTISLYFEGWVEHVADELNQASQAQGDGDLLYSIYSGGDDLFFVGAWDKVLDLARLVRWDFTRFTAQHPGLHTSAGLVLVAGKYPLAQAALDAGEAEHQAKSLRWYDSKGHVHTKDAFTFLGQTLPWARFGLDDDAEYEGDRLPDTVSGLAMRLAKLADAKAIPRALLQQLIRLQLQVEEAARIRRERGLDLNQIGQPQILWGPWMWQGQYKLKRMAGRNSDSLVQTLANRLHDENFRSITWMGLAARWADLLTRQ